MFVSGLLTRGHGAWAILAAAGLLLCVGCGAGDYSGPAGTVSGTVTLGGAAVPAGCTVNFVSGEGFTATGTVDSGGNYKLTRIGKAGDVLETIPAGTYQVSVTPPAEEMSDADYDKMMEQTASGEQPQTETGSAVIPAKYQSTETSDLSKEVTEGANTIKIELE